MNPSESSPKDASPSSLPGVRGETGEYTLEILAQITGVSTQTVLEYQEHGIIHPSCGGGSLFDDEAIRSLRRLQHVRETCEMNLSGVKLLAGLLEEVERLRAELREVRRR